MLLASSKAVEAEDSGETLQWHRAETPTRQRSLCSLAQVPGVVDELMHVMQRNGYGRDDLFAVRLALEVAVVNAVKHGHKNDRSKVVRVWWFVSSMLVRLVVEDEGPGLNFPTTVPAQCHPEDRRRARGLELISKCMTWTRFNRRGNRIVMCRRRSDTGTCGSSD
jgi:serine/threonine-protein kinase RsbW